MANKSKYTVLSKGVPEGIKKFFREKAKEVNLELKSSEKDYTPEERMKLLAVQAYRSKCQDTIRASLEQKLSLDQEEHKKNPSKELEEQIKLETSMLQVFNATIKKLKDQETLAKEEEARELFEAIKKCEKSVNDLYNTFLEDIKKLQKSLKEENKANVGIMTKVLLNHLNDIVSRRTKLAAAVKKYEDFTGIKYKTQAAQLKLSNETVEALYELTIKLKEKSKDKDTIEKCNKLISNYKHFMYKPDEYDALKAKVDGKIAEEKRKVEANSKDAIRSRLLEVEKEFLQKYQDKMNQFSDTQDLFLEMKNRLHDIFDEYPDLELEEKQEFEIFIYDKISEDLSNVYGENLKEAIAMVTEINTKITKLVESNFEFGTKEFEEEYNRLFADIKTFEVSEVAKKSNIDVVFDEEKQMLHIMFRTNLVKDFSRTVVSEKVLAKMAEAKKGASKGSASSGSPETTPETTPETEPVKTKGKGEGASEGTGKGAAADPTPTTDPETEPEKKDSLEEERDKAISNYIELLREINDQYRAINDCNRRMSALAYVDFNNLDANTVSQIATIENTAQEHDMNIIRTRLALSNARAELRKKYNCYVTSIKEVAEFPVINIDFGNDYELFIAEYGKLVVEAELELKKLSEEMNDKNTSPERKAELKTKIDNLYKYIQTVNKFIDRRIISESTEKGLDIVTLLRARNEEKKKLRAELEKILSPKQVERKEPIETPEQVQARLIQELEISLKEVYARWLKAIELGEEINEELFNNEINNIINNSELSEKEKIASEMKKEFEKEKERYLIGRLNGDLESLKQSIDLMNITDEFANEVVAKYEQLREKYEIIFDKFGMIYSLEENKVRILINAEPPQVPGLSIEADMMSDKKKQEYQEFLDSKKKVQVTEEQILNTVRTIIGKNTTDDVKTIVSVLQLIRKQSPEVTMRILEILDERGVIKLTDDGKFEQIIESYDVYRKEFHNVNTIISPVVPTKNEVSIPEVRVSKPTSLKLRTDKPAIINRLNSKVLTVDELGLKIIKNGFSIKYSESLRQELKALNAKLSLVQKGDGLRRRTSINFDETKEEQKLAFKKISDDFDAKDYKIEIRARQTDENGKPTNRSDLVYDLEMTEELVKQLEPEKGRSL